MENIQPDLSDYAIIGDCRTAAMVSRSGSIDWLCLPDFDSASVFGRLLDYEKGGCFSIAIANMQSMSRRYLPDTAILETILRSPEGAIRITDCMPVLPNARHSDELEPLREILRRAEVIEGNPVIEVMLDAMPGYASCRGDFRFRGELGWAMQYRHYLLNLVSNFKLAPESGALQGCQTAKAGDCFWFSLTYERHFPGVLLPIGSESEHRIAVTGRWWKSWCGGCHYQGRWRDEVMRSAITLRLLTCTLSGALLAAATASLPERPGGWMNWDYRYCWPRDAALTLSAFMSIGLRREADAFFDWLMTAAVLTSPSLSVMYDIYGHYKVHERTLPLAGYRGATPVRIGNKLMHQVQHDVYGEVMLAVEDWMQRFGKPELAEQRLIEGFGKALESRWREPDNGIWELRGERRHYTYSKVMAWHVFDSLLRLHDKEHIRVPANAYMRERDALCAAIEQHGFNRKRNCYVGVFDSETLDASLLLLPRTGYIAYDDPRMTGTWQAIREDLEENGLLLRYPPGFAGSEPGEGAFIVCNFWAVDYLAGAGRRDEAEERFSRLVSLANDVGLYNECADIKTGRPLGNMPQAFSHAGFINSVLALERGQGQKAPTAKVA